MQSGGGLDGCRHRTDATCKTVANKGISFVYAVLGPYYIPLRLTKHDGSVGYGSRTSVIRSFSEVSTAA